MATTVKASRTAQREFLTGDIDFGAPLDAARLEKKRTDPKTTECPPPNTDSCPQPPPGEADVEGVEERTPLCPPPDEA